MKLKTLVLRQTWDKTSERMPELYPRVAGHELAFAAVHNELIQLEPAESDMTIILRDCHDEYDNTHYVGVSGSDGTTWADHLSEPRPGDDTLCLLWAIELTDWAEWLGMEVEQESLDKYGELDTLCHCMWEMTFHGMTREAVLAKAHDILERDYDFEEEECESFSLREGGDKDADK